jgi:hypothetical protein
VQGVLQDVHVAVNCSILLVADIILAVTNHHKHVTAVFSDPAVKDSERNRLPCGKYAFFLSFFLLKHYFCDP